MTNQGTIQRSFNVPEPAGFSLSNVGGSIEIGPGPEGEIKVEATPLQGTGDIARTKIEMSQNRHGHVKVQTRFDLPGLLGIFGKRGVPADVSYRVRIPQSCDIAVSAVSGTLDIEGLAGDFDLSTVSGEIRLTHLDGNIRLSNVGGSLHAVGLAGKLDFETVSGDLTFRASHLALLAGSSVSGDVRLELEAAPESAAIETISGDVYLNIPPDAALSLELNSLSGRIFDDKNAVSGLKRIRRQSAAFGAGGSAFSVTSLSGNLHMVGREDAGDQPDSGVLTPVPERPHPGSEAETEPPPSSATNPDVMAILERIERGELSVSDGLTALEN